jgi:hypothetical protein
MSAYAKNCACRTKLMTIPLLFCKNKSTERGPPVHHTGKHKLNMELDLTKVYLGSMCKAVLIG